MAVPGDNGHIVADDVCGVKASCIRSERETLESGGDSVVIEGGVESNKLRVASKVGFREVDGLSSVSGNALARAGGPRSFCRAGDVGPRDLCHWMCN